MQATWDALRFRLRCWSRHSSHCSVIGEGGGIAAAIEAEDDGGDAVEQITVVGDEDERALEFEQSFFEDLEGGNVEVVGGLVEEEDVGGLKHEAGDEDAGALASAEAADGLVELLGGEEKTVGPGGDVDDAVLKDDGIGVRGEGAAQGERRDRAGAAARSRRS